MGAFTVNGQGWMQMGIMEPDWYEKQTPAGTFQIVQNWEEDQWVFTRDGWQVEEPRHDDDFEILRTPDLAETMKQADAYLATL